MRVLIYSFPFAPQIGGLERLTEQTARRLAMRGLEVTVVTDTPTDRPERDRDLPFKVVRRPALRTLVGLVRRSDVIQLNGFDIAAFASAFLMRRPIVWQHIDYDTIDPRGMCSRYGRSCTFNLRRCWHCLRSDHSVRGALRVLAAFAAKIVAARLVRVNLVAAAYAANRLRLPRAEVLPLGVDSQAFSPTPTAASPEAFTVLFSGRHIPSKGCDVLVRALALCRDRGHAVEAVITGDGPERRNSQRLAASLGLDGTVAFIGIVPDLELVRLTRAAGAAIVPCTNDEYFGLTALEAMSCGTPVIAADAGALPEVVRDGGLLFPAGDADQLAKQIVRLAGDAELRLCLRRRARARAEELSEARMVDAYVAVYNLVAGEPR